MHILRSAWKLTCAVLCEFCYIRKHVSSHINVTCSHTSYFCDFLDVLSGAMKEELFSVKKRSGGQEGDHHDDGELPCQH